MKILTLLLLAMLAMPAVASDDSGALPLDSVVVWIDVPGGVLISFPFRGDAEYVLSADVGGERVTWTQPTELHRGMRWMFLPQTVGVTVSTVSGQALIEGEKQAGTTYWLCETKGGCDVTLYCVTPEGEVKENKPIKIAKGMKFSIPANLQCASSCGPDCSLHEPISS